MSKLWCRSVTIQAYNELSNGNYYTAATRIVVFAGTEAANIIPYVGPFTPIPLVANEGDMEKLLPKILKTITYLTLTQY